MSKSQMQTIVAVVLVLLLALWAYVGLWFMPKWEMRSNLITELEILELQISEAEVRRIQYNKLTAELESLEQDWSYLSVLMPTGFESTVAMYFIQTGMEEYSSGLSIDLTAPWNEFAGALVYPVRISYSTVQDSIEDTLAELEVQPFVFRLSSMGFTRSGGEDGEKLGMNVTLDYLVNNPGMTLGDVVEGEKFGTLAYRNKKIEEALNAY